MSDGKRDVDPQGGNGSQDVYARVASAAASRSGDAARSGDGSSRGTGSTAGTPTGTPSKAPGQGSSNGSGRPATPPTKAAAPAKAAPAKGAAPAKAAPATSTPPAQAGPIKAAPAKAAPAKASPAKAAPAKAAPAKAAPAKAAPAKAGPGKAGPAQAVPVTKESVQGVSAKAGPATSKPADPEPAPAARPAEAAHAGPDAQASTATAGKGFAETWKGKLGAMSRRVLGTDQPKADGSSSESASAKPAAHAADPSNEATAVVALPTVSRAVPAVPAARSARTTGTRTAPVPAPAGGTNAAKVETLDTDKQPKVGAPRRTRKARLRLSRVDPWSVMKTAFMFSIAGGIMLVVGVYAIWTVISGSGLFDNVNDIIASVVSTPGDTTPFRVEDYINTPKVMGVTAFLACIDVVIFTALATLGSFLYNLAATMLGGLEITLAED